MNSILIYSRGKNKHVFAKLNISCQHLYQAINPKHLKLFFLERMENRDGHMES